jgi:competence protein ComEC
MKHNLTLLTMFVIVLIRLLYVDAGERGAGDGFNAKYGPVFSNIRESLYLKLQKIYPSPHAELLAGTVLGYNALNHVPTFNDILLRSGTIHVVVVSGFNIVLLFNFVERLLGSIYKFRNYLFALILTLVYAVFTGFGYPVIRAWLMSALSFSAKYLGLNVSQLHVVMFTGLAMLMLSPLTLYELSFQLSFLAVTGLIVVSPVIASALERLIPRASPLLDDFSTSLAAQCTVWPLLSYSFGSINLISPFANSLVLWTIPRITVLGLIGVCLIPIKQLSILLSFAIYPFLDFFVELTAVFARAPFASIGYKIPFSGAVLYYCSLVLVIAVYKRKYATV